MPVIVLTARDALDDRVAHLDAGAPARGGTRFVMALAAATDRHREEGTP